VVGLHEVVSEATVAVAGGAGRAKVAVAVGAGDLGAGRPSNILLITESTGYAGRGGVTKVTIGDSGAVDLGT
jgi:hypothetical protein